MNNTYRYSLDDTVSHTYARCGVNWWQIARSCCHFLSVAVSCFTTSHIVWCSTQVGWLSSWWLHSSWSLMLYDLFLLSTNVLALVAIQLLSLQVSLNRVFVLLPAMLCDWCSMRSASTCIRQFTGGFYSHSKDACSLSDSSNHWLALLWLDSDCDARYKWLYLLLGR